METLAVALSADAFYDLPQRDDGLKQELIDGVLVVSGMPTDHHEAMVVALLDVLLGALRGRRDLALRASNGGVMMGPDTVLRPDLFVYRRIPGNPYPSWRDVPTPLLVIEILSPATAKRDRGVKRERYLAAGVGELWIVDLVARHIERWRPGAGEPDIVTRALAVRVDASLVLEVDLEALFGTLDQ